MGEQSSVATRSRAGTSGIGFPAVRYALRIGCALAVLSLALPAGAEGQEEHGDGGHHAALATEAIPLQVEAIPDRPAPLIELGERHLSPGELSDGIEIPGGAVWRPALWVFGTYRTAAQTFDAGPVTNGDWAHRLDLFGNLRLSGSERIVIGFQPLDQFGGVGYQFGDGVEHGWQDDFNGRLRTLFFEGDIGELLPFLDDDDSGSWDIGFSVGRQDFFAQEGVLIADNLDLVGLTRNSLRPPGLGLTNLRLTGLFAWNGLHRNNVLDTSARMLALLSEIDLPASTIAIDAIYTLADETTGDAFHAGIGVIQRIGRFNTGFRLNVSLPVEGETAAVTRGAVAFSEVSWSPWVSHDVYYVNTFLALGAFSPAAMDLGGPLGRTGILFEAAGMGRFGSPLSSLAARAVGGAIGRQFFFDGDRRQLVVELAGRKDTNGIDDGAAALGVRLQQALGRRFILRMDGFAAARQSRDDSLGGRIETLVKF